MACVGEEMEIKSAVKIGTEENERAHRDVHLVFSLALSFVHLRS